MGKRLIEVVEFFDTFRKEFPRHNMNNNVIHQNRIRQVFFILIILLLAILLFFELYFFLPALLGAVTLYIIMHRGLFYFTEEKKWKKWVTVLFLMLASMVVIFLPIWILVDMISSKISYALQHSAEAIEALKKVALNLERQLDVNIVNQENLNRLNEKLAQTLPQVLTATFETIATVFFMYFILYFMLMNGRKMELRLYEYLPVKDENVVKLRKEVHNMVLSNAVGIPIIAILQGIVGLIGYFILGVKEPMFWFVVTCITAMIPVVGAALAYVPVALIFFANGQDIKGIIMLIYGFGIIGTVDNIFRFVLQRRIGNIHPLVTVFGVIIGLKLFGFIGLIFGPLLISLFILLVKIYSSEFIVKQRDAGDITTE